MTRAMIITALITLILVMGGALYALKRAPSLRTHERQPQTATSTVTGEVPFGEFVNRGGSYSCAVRARLAMQELAGQVYTDNGLIRGEWSGDYGGKDITATFIMRNGYTYAWDSTGKSKGVKMRSDQAITPRSFEKAGLSFITPNSPNGYLNSITSYKCSPWTPDTDIFIPPNNVIFTTIE